MDVCGFGLGLLDDAQPPIRGQYGRQPRQCIASSLHLLVFSFPET